MELGRVRGSIWCTRKSGELAGAKLLLVEDCELGAAESSTKKPGKKLRVCADVIGAGVGERVLIATGYAARKAVGDEKAPVDAAVVAIVDGWEFS